MDLQVVKNDRTHTKNGVVADVEVCFSNEKVLAVQKGMCPGFLSCLVVHRAGGRRWPGVLHGHLS